jgi:tetratricopeptide (TPR) repeat protein
LPRFGSTFLPVKLVLHIAPRFLVIALLAAALLSCSRKSDSWTSRTYHKMTSKFNPYFNGEQAYLKGVASIETNQKENYEEILPLYIWGTAEQATSVSPDMDRAIEKAAKVIKDHSMVIGSKQKNAYVIKSYMLMGKARFYKQDFFTSLETFNYVIQNFSKDKKAANDITEARLWAGWCQLQIGNTISAESYFDDLLNNRKIDKRYLPDVYASKAQAFINDGLYESAEELLAEALKEGPTKEQRIRWTFVKAQLEERTDKNYEASRDYKAVISMNPRNYEMLFTAQLNRARNFDVVMENANIVYKELEKMLKDDKNIEFRDQIYYVMAEVAETEEEFEKSDDYLKRSVRSSTSNNSQKGLSYLMIADHNFMFKDYVPAQAYYDSASTTLPPAHKKYTYAKKRKQSLDGLVKNINIIATEDSMQRLAGMTEEQQRKVFERYIKNLKEEEERKAREEEQRALNEELIAQNQNTNTGPNAGQTSGWYFYNSNSRASGAAAFQKVWGIRVLEDNWRQKNKEQNIVEQVDSGDSTQTIADAGSQDIYDPAFYMAKIPKTKEQLDSSNTRIMKAYVALGDIYNQELADFKPSEQNYTKVLERYPGCPYEPRVLYALYQLLTKQGKKAEAETYRIQLIEKYPKSPFARQLIDPGKQSKNDEAYQKISALYKKEFELYQKKQYKTVLADLKRDYSVYENSLLEAKFELLKCMCLGRLQQQEEMITGLKAIVANYPNTPEQVSAQGILNLTDEGGDQTANGPSLLNNFAYNSNDPHKFVVILPNNGVDINVIRNELANFNQEFYKLDRLQVQNIFFDQDRQIVAISGLKNAAKAKVYYNSILANAKLMGYLPAQLTVKIIISDDNYRALYKDKNLEEYLKFLKDNYQITENI